MAVRTVIATTAADMRWPSADTSDNFDYTLDLTGTVDPADSLVSVTWEVSPPDITPVIPGVTGLLVTAWLAGGVPGRDYTVRVTVVTVSRTIRRDVSLFIELGAAVAFPPLTFSKAFGTPLVWVSGVSPSPPVPTSAIHLTATGAALAVDHDATIGGGLTVGGTIAGAGVTALLAPFALSSALTSGLAGKLPLTGGTLSGPLLLPSLSAASGNLKLIGVGSSGVVFQGSGGGNAFVVNGSASALANQITVVPAAAGGAPSISATGSDAVVGLTLQGKGGGGLNILATPVAINPVTVTQSGSTVTPYFTFTQSGVGSYNGNNQQFFKISQASDTINKQGTNDALPLVKIAKNWGSGVTQGQQTALNVTMVQTGAVTGETDQQHTQYNAVAIAAQYGFNVGGTGLLGSQTLGAAYGFYPDVRLLAGATNYSYFSSAEWDNMIVGTNQALTLSGTVTAGDSYTLTFTAASIVGSPVAVTYTAAAGNTLAHVENGLQSLILNNAALANAGVSVVPDLALGNTLNLTWQTQNATTVGVGQTGSGTTTLALGSVVGGASTNGRDIISLANYGTGRAFSSNNEGTLKFSGGRGSNTGGTPVNMIMVGNPGAGGIPVAPGGNLLAVVQPVPSTTGAPGWSSQLFSGFDIRPINFTQYNGFSFIAPGIGIAGTGNLNLQNAVISVTATGLTLDVPGGRIGSGNPAIVSGGGGGSGVAVGNYFAGEIVSGVNGTDTQGGQYLIDAVNASTGAVTHLTTLVQPSTTTTSLGTAISTIGGSGSGLTITPTAANNRGVIIGSAGTPVGFYGHAPAAQAATPVTLADVIAVIRGVGLAA